jgi:hypothetical protein
VRGENGPRKERRAASSQAAAGRRRLVLTETEHRTKLTGTETDLTETHDKVYLTIWILSE